MEIGIGLPNPVPGTPGGLLLDWARRAEERGFFGLATIDRVAYPNYDSLTVLAAAAGATSRIRLFTNILLAPVYPATLLAKSSASLDQISGGRLALGLAPGGRADDFAVLNVAALSLRQRAVPGDLLGRVTAAARTLTFGAAAAGALLGGVLASSAGIEAPFLFSGAVAVVATAAWAVASRPDPALPA